MQIVDSYSESNHSGSVVVVSNYEWIEVGQSFTGDGGTLDSIKFYIKKYGSPTGNCSAKVYAHTGTFGTSSVPTGSALATSGTIDVSTISTSISLVTFTFSGAEKITLTNGTKYVAVLEYGGGDPSTNNIQAGIDDTSPTHSGNASLYDDISWGYVSWSDVYFYVYKDDEAQKVGPFPSHFRI